MPGREANGSEVYVRIMSHGSDPGAPVAPDGSSVIGRRRHYGQFYGLDPLPDGFGVVIGNCQAESLRLVLDAPDRPFVRVPPVHEMDAADAERLHQILGDARLVISQPIRDDYRGLPLGTRQIAAATRGRVLTVPSVRFGGLQPFQAALRVPGVEEDPPIVAYHDVRTLAAAAGLPVAPALPPEAVRAVGEASLQTLRERETEIDVPVSDLYRTVTADHARTVNHPGNAIWLPLAARVLDELALEGGPTDPGRPLLAAVQAPLVAEVVAAWSLPDEPRAHWIVDGRAVEEAEVRDAHAAWYRANPAFVAAAVQRLAPLLHAWRAA